MAVFTLPDTRDLLKYHTRWNDQALTPYIDDLLDLWAENDVHGVLDVCMQGPMLTRFGIVPDDENVVIATNQGEPLVGGSSPAGIAYSNVVGRIEGQEIPFMNCEKSISFFSRVTGIFHKA